MLRAVARLALTSMLILGSCSPREVEDGAASSPQVEIITDVVYGHKFGMALTLDVLRPAQPNGAGIAFLNSYGYVSPWFDFVVEGVGVPGLRPDGERRLHEQFSVRSLIERGFTVFDLRHGSSPKFLLPEMVDDVRRGIRFIRRSASEYGVDPDRIGLWGGSAGGHLALMLGAASEIGPEGAEGAAAGPAPVAAIVAYFPPADVVTQREFAERWARETRGTDLVSVFPAVGYPEERDPEFSPVKYASVDDPPTLIIHGDQDRLVPLTQGRVMHDALSKAGVLSELMVIEGAGHGFEADDAAEAMQRVIEWFERYLD